MDIVDPKATAQTLIAKLGQNGASLYVQNEIEERHRTGHADGVMAWQAVADYVQQIGRDRLVRLGLWE